MLYWIISTDGNRYGPGDVEMLNTWIEEGRIARSTLLEEGESGVRIAASALQGLVFPSPVSAGTAYESPDSQSSPRAYTRPATNHQVGDGSAEVTTAWVLGVVGLLFCFCCGILVGGIGIAVSNRAKAKGHPSAQGPLILNTADVVLQVLCMIVWFTWLQPIATKAFQF